MTCTAVLSDDFTNLNNWVSGTQSLVPGRTGTGFQNFAATGSGYTISGPNQADTVTVGFAIKFSSLLADNDVLLLYGDAGVTLHDKITLGNARDIFAWLGASTLIGQTSSGSAFPAAGSGWFYFEAQVKMNDVTGFVVVRINGNTVLNLTNKDTKNAGTATVFDTVKISCGNSLNGGVIDDFYLRTGNTCGFAGDPATPRSLSDLIFQQLSAHYPTMATANASLDDLLLQYATDNPTYLRPFGTLPYYSASATETLTDAAKRWWTAYVP